MASTLSIKFCENNRNGWMPYNPYGISNVKGIEDHYCGEYDIIYYSFFETKEDRLIKSKLIINIDGSVVFYNSIKIDISDAEYVYHGICEIQEGIIYIFLKNDYSHERAIMYLIKPVGNLNRFMGLFTALSSNLVPVCIKIACFKHSLFIKGINDKILRNILTSSNINWKNSLMIFEENQKHMFYSDVILNDK